ncbi:hypothetical protein ACQ87O_00070 [Streptomyces lividans]
MQRLADREQLLARSNLLATAPLTHRLDLQRAVPDRERALCLLFDHFRNSATICS